VMPAVLMPLLLRGAGWRRGAAAWGLFAVIGALCAWPIVAGGIGGNSGFASYAENWVNNEGLFRIHAWIWKQVHLEFWITSHHSGVSSRAATAIAIAAIAIGLIWRRPRDGGDLSNRIVLLLAAVFILSPTQFPWYFVWMLPAVALAPRWSLLVYPTLLSGYYLQWLSPHVVWLEHVPVYLLLGSEMIFGRPRWSEA